MKHIQTPSQMFMAVKLETTGNVLRKPFDVVKKFSIVVTPVICHHQQYIGSRQAVRQTIIDDGNRGSSHSRQSIRKGGECRRRRRHERRRKKEREKVLKRKINDQEIDEKLKYFYAILPDDLVVATQSETQNRI